MERTLWTPCFSAKYDFAVYLDRPFAREMIQAKIPTARQEAMNNLGNKVLRRLEIDRLEPYSFHKDSCFVTGVYLGQNGVWLAADTTSDELLKDKSTRLIEYHSHNVDNSKQAHTLLALFDQWVTYSDILKDS